MLESFNTDKFEYQRISPEEQKQRGILGRLVGVIADTKSATRNGRKYGLDLWKKVFDDPIMKEKIANRCVFSELGHPEDRAEIDMEKICACLAEQPKIGKDGKLYGVFDILDTGNGRILKTLCDYGTTVGISSRGTGDIYTDEDGNEAVDPDTYECECFDIVLIPAVEEARLQYVTEDYHGKTLKQALKEEYDRAAGKDKKVMKETLTKLELVEDDDLEEAPIDILQDVEKHSGIESAQIETEDQIIKIEISDKDDRPLEDENSSDSYIDEFEEESETEIVSDDAKNFGVDEIVESLQETLKRNRELEKRLETLQSTILASNARETKLEEELKRYKEATKKLSVKISDYKELQEKLTRSEKQIQRQETKIKKLNETINRKTINSTTLQEAVDNSKLRIKELETQCSKLTSKIQQNSELLSQNTDKLKRAKELVEKYKKAAKLASDKYIGVKAQLYGLSTDQVSSRLNESYTLKDVDDICENLSSRKLKVSKLPFEVSKGMKVKATESINESLTTNRFYDDDVVDESLLRLANIDD